MCKICNDRIKLFDGNGKNICEKYNTEWNNKYLMSKILMGDVSDNIPSVFPKCGPKTAQQCIEDEDFFKKKMAGNEAYYNQYKLNSLLIDFNNGRFFCVA